ncbi:dTMP kinase [Stappia sp. ES.058]|uniref:dTMP kinase n=1 Tax=Stappia sp. ES.058 TaxID=1881061 RepID=UPI000879E458|nr:dTMP kinase [Stappia sp. ES.058]SDU09324.1 thymidylate kinase [Stappia sp. ES.058]
MRDEERVGATREALSELPRQGRFITFEGGEGAGKSTQISRLKDRLNAAGISAIVTREPGGSPTAETIRELLLSGKVKPLGAEMEAVMFAAARADHVDEKIRPALASGDWVLCDRFADSTRVYQGEAGVDPAFLDRLEAVAVGGYRPDMTVLIDVSPDVGLSRVAARSGASGSSSDPDRFETDTKEVHMRRRQLFLDLAASEPSRFAVIDGGTSADAVANEIWQAVRARFPVDLGHAGPAAPDARRDRIGG